MDSESESEEPFRTKLTKADIISTLDIIRGFEYTYIKILVRLFELVHTIKNENKAIDTTINQFKALFKDYQDGNNYDGHRIRRIFHKYKDFLEYS